MTFEKGGSVDSHFSKDYSTQFTCLFWTESWYVSCGRGCNIAIMLSTKWFVCMETVLSNDVVQGLLNDPNAAGSLNERIQLHEELRAYRFPLGESSLCTVPYRKTFQWYESGITLRMLFVYSINMQKLDCNNRKDVSRSWRQIYVWNEKVSSWSRETELEMLHGWI